MGSDGLDGMRAWLNSDVGKSARGGMAAAVERARLAQGLQAEPAAAYAAVAESVWWIVAIHDRARIAAGSAASTFAKLRDGDQGGRRAWGLRYARHRITHALPVALAHEAGGPLVWRGPDDDQHLALSRGYYWVPSADLGEPDKNFKNEAEREAYDNHVAGLAMQRPLVHAKRWIERLAFKG